ncbi:alpha-galactosidase, partial [Lactobacillus sp. XV13L]|nr:alpha-galactosidase [Lactobacillus sp. XV13L]
YNSNYTKDMTLSIPHNGWVSELQWQELYLQQLGLVYDSKRVEPTSKVINISNSSSWSCGEYSPQAILQNHKTNQVSMWQIENNGAWHYEVEDDSNGLLTIQIGGPEEHDNHWWKALHPNESFSTSKIAFVQMDGNFERAIGEITNFRRLIRRVSIDNQKLPVIFNDYMNCLFGDPTTEKELPLIDAAKDVGAEYFVVDCGWYADGYWWDS